MAKHRFRHNGPALYVVENTAVFLNALVEHNRADFRDGHIVIRRGAKHKTVIGGELFIYRFHRLLSPARIFVGVAADNTPGLCIKINRAILIFFRADFLA